MGLVQFLIYHSQVSNVIRLWFITLKIFYATLSRWHAKPPFAGQNTQQFAHLQFPQAKEEGDTSTVILSCHAHSFVLEPL